MGTRLDLERFNRRLEYSEKQAVTASAWPLLKIHIEAAGHPVKLPGSFNFNAVCGGSVGHELAHRLPAVGRLVLPAGLCNFAARRLERLGQHPRRQLAGLYG